jgi:phosphate transport system protein
LTNEKIEDEDMAQHLQREIDRLKRKILALGALVEDDLRQAVKALGERDDKLARRVVETDIEIDNMEVDVEEDCLKILALHQPVAIDLRFIIAVLKINNDLERIGDLSANIAERAASISKQEPVESPYDFPEMSQKVQAMLHTALDSLVNLDSKLAHTVLAADDEVDAINRSMYERVQQHIRRSPDKMDTLIQMLAVSRNLERIADHTTNIAEDVIYMIDGEIIRHGAKSN